MLVSMPFIFDSPEHSLAVFDGEIGDEIGDYLLENHGIRALRLAVSSARASSPPTSR